MSSNKAAPISKDHTRIPNAQERSIASQSVIPKLEPVDTPVPPILIRTGRAQTPRGPRSTTSCAQPKRLRTITRREVLSDSPSNATQKRPQISTRRPPSPSPGPTNSYSIKQKINRHTRELWDTRREISAAQARQSVLEQKIRSLDPEGGGVPEPPGEILESEAARGEFLCRFLVCYDCIDYPI